MNMKLEHLSIQVGLNPSANFFSKTVEELCKMLWSGKMDYFIDIHENSWSRHQMVSLLNNVALSNYPITPIAVNIETFQSYDPNEGFVSSLPKIMKATYERSKNSVLFDQTHASKYTVIDGHQRLNCFLKAYTDDPDFAHVVFDLSYCKFREVLTVEDNQIPVGKLCNKDFSIFMDYVADRYDGEVISMLNAIRNKFLNYSILVVYATNLFINEQIDWFTLLNGAGSSLTESEVFLFKLRGKNIDGYQLYVGPYNKMIIEAGFDSLLSTSRARTSYPLTALNPLLEKKFSNNRKNNYTPIPSDVKLGILDAIPPEELKSMFSESLEALRWTLDFFKAKGILPVRMEYVTYISGFYILRNPTVNSYDMLEHWYRNTLFTDASNTEKRQIYSRLLSMEVL